MTAEKHSFFRLNNSVFENDIVYASKANFNECPKFFLHPIKKGSELFFVKQSLPVKNYKSELFLFSQDVCLEKIIEEYPSLAEYFTGQAPQIETHKSTWANHDILWKSFAEVSKEKSEQVENTLKDLGALRFERDLDVPNYQSKHIIPNPESLFLIKDQAEITYTPYTGSEKEEHTYEFIFSHSFTNQTEILQLIANNTRAFKWHNIIVVEFVPKGQERAEYRFIGKSKDTMDLWKSLQEHSSVMSPEGTYNKIEENLAEKLKEVGLESFENELYFLPQSVAKIQKQYNHVLQHAHVELSFQLVFDHQLTSDNINELTGSTQEAISKKLKQEIRLYCKKYNLPYVLRKHLFQVWQKGSLDFSDYQLNLLEKQPILPHSEKGYFEIKGCDPQQALDIMNELGFFETLEKEEANTAFRRVIANHYTQREKFIPAGNMVLHGMTGIKKYHNVNLEICSRLKSMAECGGILSSFERRRIGLKFHSMSPLGDIAAGIDKYVPCKIGDSPHYGSGAFFGMKPSILNRKDIFFAPYDFGAEVADRHQCFQDYAKSIGQEHMYSPITCEAVQQHMKEGIKATDNEVYFKYQISWNEIDTIWLVGLEDITEIQQTWDNLCKQYPELENINFEFVDQDQLPKSITARANQI